MNSLDLKGLAAWLPEDEPTEPLHPLEEMLLDPPLLFWGLNRSHPGVHLPFANTIIKNVTE